MFSYIDIVGAVNGRYFCINVLCSTTYQPSIITLDDFIENKEYKENFYLIQYFKNACPNRFRQHRYLSRRDKFCEKYRIK